MDDSSAPSSHNHNSDGATASILASDPAETSTTTSSRIRSLITARIAEGCGECVWDIGVGEDGEGGAKDGAVGLPEDKLEVAIAEVTDVAASLGCVATTLLRRPAPKDATRWCAVVLIRRKSSDSMEFTEVRFAVCGNVDSGKSTFVSVLTYGALDDGRGSARSLVCNHRHEQSTGRTSSVAERVIGFDSNGNVLNYSGTGPMPREQVAALSSKVITLYDLAGHEKYLRTTMHSMSGSVPDYALVIVSANNGVQRMTKEHVGLCVALKIPMIFVVTRIDSTPQNVFKETMANIQKMIKSPGIKKLPYLINSTEDVLVCARHIKADKIVPVVCVSNVTGEGLDTVRAFMNVAPVRRQFGRADGEGAEVVIDHTFFITGVGTVVSGIVSAGTVRSGETLLIGPDNNGHFRPVVIRGMQILGNNIDVARPGQNVGFALKKEKRAGIRKGMLLLSMPGAGQPMPKAVWEFDAEVLILYHSTTIKTNYQPIVHCRTVRQAARIVALPKRLVSQDDAATASSTTSGAQPAPQYEEEACMRTGDKAVVRFRFMYHAEYLRPGMRLVFREGRTKGIGTVVSVVEEPETVEDKRKTTRSTAK